MASNAANRLHQSECPHKAGIMAGLLIVTVRRNSFLSLTHLTRATANFGILEVGVCQRDCVALCTAGLWGLQVQQVFSYHSHADGLPVSLKA